MSDSTIIVVIVVCAALIAHSFYASSRQKKVEETAKFRGEIIGFFLGLHQADEIWSEPLIQDICEFALLQFKYLKNEDKKSKAKSLSEFGIQLKLATDNSTKFSLLCAKKYIEDIMDYNEKDREKLVEFYIKKLEYAKRFSGFPDGIFWLRWPDLNVLPYE